MTTFNKYAFLEDLANDLKTEIEKYDVQDMDSVLTLIDEAIDNQCIYYADCFDICKELNATDFTAYEMPCNTINALAFAALYEFVHAEFDYLEINDLIDNKLNA